MSGSFDNVDRAYLTVGIPLVLAYTIWVMRQTYLSQEIDLYDVQRQLIDINDRLTDIKLQLNNNTIADIDKKLVENKKRDDELIAKIAADVLAKVKELDKQVEICEDARSAVVDTTLHVDCKMPSGPSVYMPLSTYIYGVKRGSIIEGYSGAKFG